MFLYVVASHTAEEPRKPGKENLLAVIPPGFLNGIRVGGGAATKLSFFLRVWSTKRLNEYSAAD
jgi:hypothetical protein